jgi:multiple sugar transport system ATP-binding protein
MADVAFEQVEKVYPGGTRALTDLTLALDDGELLVVVGPSGCGKSTLLRLLAGLESPTSGTLRIDGRVVNVAMVFQDYALYPFKSVRENLAFPLRMRKLGADEIDRRVAWVADLLDLAPLLDRLPRQLSGGQRQRVAMGRALVRDPSVSLLDEPLSNLDAKLRVQVRGEIGELQRRTGTTMLYVTHDQVEAMTLGHRVAVLRDGRLQQVAPPQELYDHPVNVFIAGFIGNPPMNIFPTRIVQGAGGDMLTLGTLRVPLPRDLHPPRAGPLTGGIRPEAFRFADAGRVEHPLPVTVEHVEYLGHETLAHVRVDGEGSTAIRVVARLPRQHDIAPGARLILRVDERDLHVFDAEGQAIAR